MARFAAAGGLAVLLLVGPWVARNVAAYGQPGLLLSINRNLLVYKAMYSAIDTQLPKLQAVSQELGSATVDYDWLWRLIAAYPTPEAERVARDLWREQIAAHPSQFAVDIAKAAAAMGGFYYWNAGDLTAVAIWLRQYVPHSDLLDANNRQMDGYAGFRYAVAPWQGDLPNLATSIWSRAGLAYLYLLRPLLTVALAIALGRYLWLLGTRRLPYLAARDVMLLVLSVAFAANAVLHVVTLAVNDRFAGTFDLLAVFLLLLAVDSSQALRANVPSARMQPYPPAT
jgi:hypothetical protein